MIRLIKEIYLTGFSIIFRASRARKITHKAGSAIALLTLIDWMVLLGIAYCIEMCFLKQPLFSHFSKAEIIIAFLALALANQYILWSRGHGIKFEREFNSLKRSKRILLLVSFGVLTVAAVAFCIWSTIVHRRFIGAD